MPSKEIAPTRPPALKIAINKSMVCQYVTAYSQDKHFGPLVQQVGKEDTNKLKFQAYRLTELGLLLFMDPDS
jgi:hypothetical protein